MTVSLVAVFRMLVFGILNDSAGVDSPIAAMRMRRFSRPKEARNENPRRQQQ